MSVNNRPYYHVFKQGSLWCIRDPATNQEWTVSKVGSIGIMIDLIEQRKIKIHRTYGVKKFMEKYYR